MTRALLIAAAEALEEIGDEWGFTSERALPKRQEVLKNIREYLTNRKPDAWMMDYGHPDGPSLMKEAPKGGVYGALYPLYKG